MNTHLSTDCVIWARVDQPISILNQIDAMFQLQVPLRLRNMAQLKHSGCGTGSK